MWSPPYSVLLFLYGKDMGDGKRTGIYPDADLADWSGEDFGYFAAALFFCERRYGREGVRAFFVSGTGRTDAACCLCRQGWFLPLHGEYAGI